MRGDIRDVIIFHGGCIGCTRQLTEPESVEYCIGCRYFNANWGLPDLSQKLTASHSFSIRETSKSEVDRLREDVKLLRHSNHELINLTEELRAELQAMKDWIAQVPTL